MPEELRQHEDHETLEHPGRDERRLISARGDQPRDDWNEQRGAATIPGGDDSCREPTPTLEPLERRPDRAAVDEGRADARDAVHDVEHRQRRRIAEPGPAEAAEQTCGADEAARAEPIDEPTVQRLDPRLTQDEQRERELDVGAHPARLRLHRLDEQQPRILQVGDHDHRHERSAQLKPAIVDAHDAPPANRFAAVRCARSSSSFTQA